MGGLYLARCIFSGNWECLLLMTVEKDLHGRYTHGMSAVSKSHRNNEKSVYTGPD